MSSCSSLAIRVRSVSCASINLRLKVAMASSASFRSVMSAITERTQGSPLTSINSADPHGCSNLTILSTSRNLQIFYAFPSPVEVQPHLIKAVR